MDTFTLDVSPCDTISYLYFCLAFILFASGSVITLLSIEESHLFNTVFTRFWIIGPLFLCSGLVVAFKTLIYIRKKTLITLLARQTLLASLNESNPSYWLNNNNNNNRGSIDNISNISLPPSYETAISSNYEPTQKVNV